MRRRDPANPVDHEADIVQRNVGLVIVILKKILDRRRQFTGGVTEDDLRQAGMFGLLEAVRAFDHRRGLQFSTFAAYRIRGAMLDVMRSTDVMYRTARRRKTAIGKTRNILRQRLEREPSILEIADELGISAAQVEEWRSNWERAKANADIERLRVATNDGPARLYTNDDRSIVRRALERLAPREQDILYRYFWREEEMKSIAASYGVTQGAVSHWNKAAFNKLRRLVIELGYDATGHNGRPRTPLHRRTGRIDKFGNPYVRPDRRRRAG
jgi:RNA polymerase sigma factor for flagellar operon FliA